MLRIADLHPAYAAASVEEATLMANLGAAVYGLVRERLHASWSAVLGTEDTVKADVWRSEGRMAALEEVKAAMAEAEKLSVRLAAAEGTTAALRAGVEIEVTRRLVRELEGARKDYDLVKAGEVAGLKEALAKAAGQSAAYSMLVEAHDSMKARIADLEEEVSVHRAAATKSSHVIGKTGEATVLELLETGVVARFEHAELRDMTAVGHAADFHLTVMGPDGRRVKLLIDSKKYKRAVNSDEIAKLNGDIDADEEAAGGILISLDSGICTKKQFQVARTPKQKPVLYMSFQEVAAEMQRELLCWGVRVLASIMGERDDAERSAMLENIDAFVAGVESAVKDIDGVIRLQMKAVEGMRDVRRGLLGRITAYKSGAGIDGGDEVIEHEEEGCSAIVKATGGRCGKRVVDGERCGNHRLRKTES